MTRKLLLVTLMLILLCPVIKGQPPLIWSVNNCWKYLLNGADFAQRPKADDSKWETINLPHTWNAKDPFDDDTLCRGISWYRKKIMLDSRFNNKKLYLNFEEVGQAADVYVNGIFAGQHKGGYTAFTFDVTRLVKLADKPTENLIALQVITHKTIFYSLYPLDMHLTGESTAMYGWLPLINYIFILFAGILIWAVTLSNSIAAPQLKVWQ